MPEPSSWQTAEQELSGNHLLRDLVAQYGPCPVKPRSDYFAALCEAIVSQQLAAKAADAIYKRFAAFFHDNPTPQAVATTPVPDLRALGLSNQKATYILDLADHFLRGLLSPACFSTMEDAAIIKQLTQVKGVGTWTAQMFLIFSLHRPDVFPVDDLGIKKAVQHLYNLENLPDKKQMETLSAPWKPYRSLASWYLWRSLENK